VASGRARAWSWQMRADKAATATVTMKLLAPGGATVDTATKAITITSGRAGRARDGRLRSRREGAERLAARGARVSRGVHLARPAPPRFAGPRRGGGRPRRGPRHPGG